MARPKLAKPNYRLRKNRNGMWEILWTEGGRTRTLSTRTSDLDGAEVFLAQFLEGIETPPPPRQPMIRDVLDGYMKSRIGDGARSVHTLKNSCNQLSKVLGSLRPEHVSQSTVKRYASERKLKGIGDGTIIRELGVLRAAVHWAVREEWIQTSIDFLMPVKQPAPRDRWLTRDEAQKLLQACVTPHVRLFTVIALSTGARKAAISELTWDRVDLVRGVINFGQGHGNKRRAIVPVTGKALEELRAAHEVRTTDFVLEWGGEPAGDVKIAFGKACKRAGLTDVTPHILRHTAATWMVESGVDSEEAARFLGTTKDMIERVYGKHSPHYLRNAANALSL